MVITRVNENNIISYVDFSKIYHMIKCFPDLKQALGKEDITFPLSSSSREIERRKSSESIRTICGSN